MNLQKKRQTICKLLKQLNIWTVPTFISIYSTVHWYDFLLQNPNMHFWRLFYFYFSANHNSFMKTSLFFISIKLHLPKCLPTSPSYLSSFICFLFFTYFALNVKFVRVQFLPPFFFITLQLTPSQNTTASLHRSPKA